MSKFLFKVVLDATDPVQLGAAANFLQTLTGSAKGINGAAQKTEPVKVVELAEKAPTAKAEKKTATAKKPEPKQEAKTTAPEETKTSTEAAESTTAKNDKATAVDSATVRELLSKKVQDHRDAVKKKLGELGAKNLTTLDPDKYGDFYSFLQTLN